MYEQCDLLNIMDVRSQARTEEKHILYVQPGVITFVFIPFRRPNVT